jgi:hypothetical protein
MIIAVAPQVPTTASKAAGPSPNHLSVEKGFDRSGY